MSADESLAPRSEVEPRGLLGLDLSNEDRRAIERDGAPPCAASEATRFGAAFAALIAALAVLALGAEFARAMRVSMADGYGIVESFYFYIRYFTILTNMGIAALMGVTALRMRRGAVLPPARDYVFALVYIMVVCVTYEALLRAEWSPRGLQFVSDMTMHDIVPVLTLLFWIGFAPKRGLRWRDPVLLLIYPALYLLATLVGGALGEGYPYYFFDASKFGYPVVLRTSLVFLVVFYGLGACLTALARARAAAVER
jgi:hypothetical protein